jgi:hypothetical protein
MSTHPKTKELYDKAGFEYIPKTEEYVMMKFDIDTKGKPRRYRIDQMYRVKQVDRDYIVYNQTIISSDFPGNEKTASETVGFHEEPTFEYRYDERTNQPKPAGVASRNVVYEIPATRQNILGILDGTYGGSGGEEQKKKEMVKINTNFVLQAGDNAKYGGFTLDEFSSRHFDDLEFKATKGFYPKELKPFAEEVEQQEKEEEQEKKQPKQQQQQKEQKQQQQKLEQPKKDLLVGGEGGDDNKKKTVESTPGTEGEEEEDSKNKELREAAEQEQKKRDDDNERGGGGAGGGSEQLSSSRRKPSRR